MERKKRIVRIERSAIIIFARKSTLYRSIGNIPFKNRIVHFEIYKRKICIAGKFVIFRIKI